MDTLHLHYTERVPVRAVDVHHEDLRQPQQPVLNDCAREVPALLAHERFWPLRLRIRCQEIV